MNLICLGDKMVDIVIPSKEFEEKHVNSDQINILRVEGKEYPLIWDRPALEKKRGATVTVEFKENETKKLTAVLKLNESLQYNVEKDPYVTLKVSSPTKEEIEQVSKTMNTWKHAMIKTDFSKESIKTAATNGANQFIKSRTSITH